MMKACIIIQWFFLHISVELVDFGVRLLGKQLSREITRVKVIQWSLDKNGSILQV